MLARAFHDDPAWRWVIPDAPRRFEVLDWLFLRGLEVSTADLWAAGEGSVAGVARWIPPGRAPASPSALLGATAALPFRFRGATRRFFAYGRSIGALRRRTQPQGSWYLDGIGVDPDRQREGIGAALMVPGIEGADAARAPVYLLTNNPDNLGFYEGFGFRIAAREETPAGGPLSWAMTRRPG